MLTLFSEAGAVVAGGAVADFAVTDSATKPVLVEGGVGSRAGWLGIFGALSVVVVPVVKRGNVGKANEG